MIVKNDKIVISQRNMNRIFFGTKKVWEVLRAEGARVLAAANVPNGTNVPLRVPMGQHPWGEVLGIDLMDQKLRYMTDWSHKFIASNPIAGEAFRIRELRVSGLPPIIVDPRSER